MKSTTNKEQKVKLNTYKLSYQKNTYKRVNVMFRFDTEKEVTDYLEALGNNCAAYIRKLVIDDVKKKKELEGNHGNFTYTLVRGIFDGKSKSEKTILTGAMNSVTEAFPREIDLKKTMRDFYNSAEEKPNKYSSMYYEVRKTKLGNDGEETGQYDTIMSISMTFEQVLKDIRF